MATGVIFHRHNWSTLKSKYRYSWRICLISQMVHYLWLVSGRRPLLNKCSWKWKTVLVKSIEILANLILFSSWIQIGSIKDVNVLVRIMKLLANLTLLILWEYFCKENADLWEFETIIDESILVKSMKILANLIPFSYWFKIEDLGKFDTIFLFIWFVYFFVTYMFLTKNEVRVPPLEILKMLMFFLNCEFWP